MTTSSLKKYLVEGYESKVISICKDAGIDCSFKNGKMYVDKEDMAKAKKALKDNDDIKELPDMVAESKLNEDSVDMEKQNTLNDIFQALEQLNTEIDELDALDSDMDSTGVGDLTDQLVTFRKHLGAMYQVLDRAGRIVPMESRGTMETARPDRESKSDKAQQKELLRLQKARDAWFGNPNHRKKYKSLARPGVYMDEAVDQALIDSVVDQIMRDIEMGDQTAIEELLMSCPEDKLRGFLSEIDESAELNELKKLAGLPQIPKRPDMGTGTDVPLGGFPKQDRTGMGTGTDVIIDPDDLPQGVRMPEPTRKPRLTYPDGTPIPSNQPMPDNLPDIPKDAYRDLFKKPMKVPPMSNDLNILRRRAGIK